MVSRTKLALLTAGVMVPLVLIAVSMSLVLAQDGELDVGVFKSADPIVVTPGEDLTYTILVTNSFGVTATNVLVTDTLPPEVQYVVDPDGCSVPSPGVVSCAPGDLDPGEEVSFAIDVHIAPDAYSPDKMVIWNTVEVTATAEGGGGDTVPDNNTADLVSRLSEEADLTVEKEIFPGDVVPVGEWFSYTLRARNLGPSTSRVPVIVDWFATDGSLSMTAGEYGACGPMPTDQGWAEAPAWLMTWLNAVCEIEPGLPFCIGDGFPWLEAWWYYWYETFPPMYPYPLAVDWMCVWYLPALEPGAWSLDRTVWVLPLDAQTIYEQAWALPDLYPLDDFDDLDNYGTPDPNILNNMDELVTQVTDEADLSVVKFSKPDEVVQAGELFTYTIFVENLGPAPAHKVSIRDEMLSDGSFVADHFILDPNRDDEGPIMLPSPEGGMTMEFHLHEPLEPKGPDNQGRWVIQIVLQADETQDVNNLVQVFTREGGSSDPDPSNNQDEDSIAVGDVADLAIEKGWGTWSPDGWPGEEAPYTPDDCYRYFTPTMELVGVVAGCPLNYSVLVTNTGPSLAENVVVEDSLPAGVTLDHVEAPGSCTTGIPGDPEAPLTCNLGSIPAFDQRTISVYVWTDADLAWEPLENDAALSSDIFDPDNGNNLAHVLTWVEPFSYLRVEKDGPKPPEIRAGEQIYYHLRIWNDGPSTAHDVHLDDELPGGVAFMGAQMYEGDGSCVPGTPHCSLGDMEPGDYREVQLWGYVDPWLPGGTVITNTMWAWADSPFNSPDGPISYTLPVTVNSWADLSIWKTADPFEVFAGEQVRYDISVANNGPSVAYDVVVTDTLPISVTYELDTDGCLQVADTNTYTCTLGTIPPGETRSFSIFARVEPDAPLGTVSNVAMVDSPSDPYNWPDDYNDRASAANLIQGRADLRVQKFGKPEGEVRAGQNLIYTIVVDNLGTGYAHNVSLDDVMRSSGTFTLVSVTPTLPALCAPSSGTYDYSLDFNCTLTNPLEVKGPTPGSGRWMLTVTVRADEPQSINNRADVESSDFDPDMSNNWDIAEHEITAVADLALTKGAMGEVLTYCDTTTLLPDEVAAGGMVTYTLTVSNTGSSTAENVVLLDEPLPSPELLEIDVQSIKPSKGSCQTGHIVDQRRLKCNLGTILPGAAATVTFVAHVPSWVPDASVLVNDAQVYSDMFDDNNGNDMATNHTIVSRVADLDVDKTQEPEVVLPGQDVTYTIVVTNTGPSDAQGVIISDTLPVEVLNPTWTCCASDEGECDVPCEPPVCPPGECPWPDIGLYAQADIPAGELVIYTVEGTMGVWPCPLPITNTVEITVPLSLVHPDIYIDPCAGNNDDHVVNQVPFCNYDPLVLKQYGGPDSPP